MPQLPPPTQHDSAYFDFLEGLKVYNYTRNIKGLLDRYEEKASEFKKERGYTPSTMEEAGHLLESELLYQFACATQHCSQHMMWSARADSIESYLEKLLDLMQSSNC